MIAIAMTGHLRPILYTHTTPPSPFDCLPTHPLPPLLFFAPPPPLPSPLLFFMRKALTASVLFSDTSHIN